MRRLPPIVIHPSLICYNSCRSFQILYNLKARALSSFGICPYRNGMIWAGSAPPAPKLFNSRNCTALRILENKGGPLAHLVEHHICNVGVASSNLARSTFFFEAVLWAHSKVVLRVIRIDESRVRLPVSPNESSSLTKESMGCFRPAGEACLSILWSVFANKESKQGTERVAFDSR